MEIIYQLVMAVYRTAFSKLALPSATPGYRNFGGQAVSQGATLESRVDGGGSDERERRVPTR